MSEITVNSFESEMYDSQNKQFDFNKFAFIDLQGFRTKSCYKHNYIRFICKEFCMIHGDIKFHAIVKSPYSFNKVPSYYRGQILWLARNYHGLTYNCGDTPIHEVVKNTYEQIKDKIVLVKGSEKILWLQYIYRRCGPINCKNIEDMDFDMSLGGGCVENEDMCEYHKASHVHVCALSNAMRIRDITFNNLNEKSSSSVDAQHSNDQQ